MENIDRRAYGDAAEELAADYLRAQKYRIRARNVPCRVGELDIVAEKDGVLVIVEVRMTSVDAMGDPSQTVMGPKQRRVVKATMYYLQQQRLGDVDVRFDVISVVGRGKNAVIEHYPGAFDAGF